MPAPDRMIDFRKIADFRPSTHMTTMLPTHHRKIEECGFNALPARHTLHYDGWLIRMTADGPKRANSVNTLGASTLPLKQKLEYCKTLFAREQVPLIFRLTDHADNAELDACLQHDDLQKIDESIVMTCALAQIAPHANAAFRELDADAWIAHMMRLDSAPPARKLSHTSLLRMLALPTVYGSMQSEGHCAAIGLAVVDGDYVGLFDIMTQPGLRRNGYARSLTSALLQSAKERGVKTAYLQVVADNLPALSLYESLGFEASYRYWYRVRTEA